MKKEDAAEEMAKNLLKTFMDMGRARGNVFFRFPENDPSAIECGYKTEFGLVKMRFYPTEGLAEWAREEGGAFRDTILDGTTIKAESGTVSLRDAKDKSFEEEGGQYLALWVMFSYFEALSMALKQALGSATQDSIALTRQKLMKVLKNEAVNSMDNILYVKVDGVEQEWERANLVASATRSHMQEEVRKVLSVEPRLDRIGALYTELHPIWRDVQRIFKDNSGRDWQGMIKAKYKDDVIGDRPLVFEADLLARAAADISKLPEKIQTLIEAKCGTDSPYTASTIAIEHAARLCGATPHQFSTRHLFEAAKRSATEEVADSDLSKPN